MKNDDILLIGYMEVYLKIFDLDSSYFDEIY